MKPKIHILPEELCNKIAAGEVVERPSSVVKELVENALDAGASNIVIELEGGGKRLIRISDDGCGMSRQDAFLAFERHATSKIATDEDLFALSTLGFRGEALASIASVARLRLMTCDNDDGSGHMIYAEGGRIKRSEEVGRPRGTVIEVRNLFFNLPARKKFLRKEQTELGHAADVVTKQALARPEVSFILKHNDRTLLELRREKGLAERVAALLGRSLLHDLDPVECSAGDDLTLSGLIAQPHLNRSSTAHIYTFINGRYIRDRVVQHAVMEGYRHLLMKGRYPVAVLFLDMDPAQVDVNVHPTKHEVRFREQSLVHDFIAESIKNTLRPADWVEQGGDGAVCGSDGGVAQENIHPQPLQSLSPGFKGARTEYAQGTAQISPLAVSAPLDSQSVASYQDSVGRVAPAYPLEEPQPQGQVREADKSGQYVLPGSKASGFFAGLQILGQYHRSYLLCQDGADLILIDQHAAHERVGFEALRHAWSNGNIPVQSLLFPEMLDLDYNAAAALTEQRESLAELGFEVEPFGGKTFAVKSVPQLLAGQSVAQLVVDVALDLERVGRSGQLRDRIDDVLITMACHSVIRANRTLTIEEMKALFIEMDKIDFKANCPHGRPVMQRLTLTAVERMFRRQ